MYLRTMIRLGGDDVILGRPFPDPPRNSTYSSTPVLFYAYSKYVVIYSSSYVLCVVRVHLL